MEKAFTSNRVRHSDRFTKLRSCLKGQALNNVPDSDATTVEEAWRNLEKAFGNPAKLMRHRKNAVLSLGKMPKENGGRGQINFKAQVDWLLKIESRLREVIDLGYKSSDLADEAYGNNFMRKIIDLFSGNTNLMLKLSQCPGTGSRKFEAVLAKISQIRDSIQGLLDITEGAHADDDGADNAHGGGGHIQETETIRSTQLV